MGCINLQNYSALRFLETREFLFALCRLYKWILGELHRSVILLNILAFHTTAKIWVTSSTPLRTRMKCLPRQLRVCICNLPFSSKKFFCQFICVSPSVTRVTRRYATKIFLTNYCCKQILVIVPCSVTPVTKSTSDTSMIPYTSHLSMLPPELPNC
jgi:hypothetical protein